MLESIQLILKVHRVERMENRRLAVPGSHRGALKLQVVALCVVVPTALFVSVRFAISIRTDLQGNSADLLLGRLRLLHGLLLLVEDKLDVARAGLVPRLMAQRLVFALVWGCFGS